MHVVAEIGRDEIVPRHGVVGQVRRQFLGRPDVGNAIVGIRDDVGEINKRIVIGRVKSAAGERAIRAADVFLVTLP